jgi:predicted small metal-binding protein
MRQVECLCGLELRGTDDGELDRLAHDHVAEHHPNDGISDEFIAKNAKDSASA